MVGLHLTLSTKLCMAVATGNFVDAQVLCLSFGHLLAISVFGLVIDHAFNQFELGSAKRACSHADVAEVCHGLRKIDLRFLVRF